MGGYRDGYDTNTTSPNTDITRQQDRQQQQPQQQQGAMKQPNSLASAMAAFQDIEHGFPRQPQLQQSQLLDEATPEQPAPVTVEITEKLISGMYFLSLDLSDLNALLIFIVIRYSRRDHKSIQSIRPNHLVSSLYSFNINSSQSPLLNHSL